MNILQIGSSYSDVVHSALVRARREELKKFVFTTSSWCILVQHGLVVHLSLHQRGLPVPTFQGWRYSLNPIGGRSSQELKAAWNQIRPLTPSTSTDFCLEPLAIFIAFGLWAVGGYQHTNGHQSKMAWQSPFLLPWIETTIALDYSYGACEYPKCYLLRTPYLQG